LKRARKKAARLVKGLGLMSCEGKWKEGHKGGTNCSLQLLEGQRKRQWSQTLLLVTEVKTKDNNSILQVGRFRTDIRKRILSQEGWWCWRGHVKRPWKINP